MLDMLLAASGSLDFVFQVAAIVTQPPAAKNKGTKLMPSAVVQVMLDRRFPDNLIFTPPPARWGCTFSRIIIRIFLHIEYIMTLNV